MIRIALIVFTLMAFTSQVSAQLIIEITKGVDNPTAIAIVPFGWEGGGIPKEDVATIIETDLQRTGQFSPVPKEDMLSMPQDKSEVYFRDWRALNVDYLLVGKLVPTAEGLQAEYALFDVYTQALVLEDRQTGSAESLRDIAHGISDRVYQKLTGIRGAFSTKLLYVSAVGRGDAQYTYRLLISDVDGARERIIFESQEPILTPSWSPDGETIAYVSFETTRPAIYSHNLRTNERSQLTNFKGLNVRPLGHQTASSWQWSCRKMEVRIFIS